MRKNATQERVDNPLGLRLVPKILDWLDSFRLSKRIGVMTYKTYRTRKLDSAVGSEVAVVERIAARSTMVQVICWPCLEEFNSQSQHGEDPDYNLAFGNVSLENALAGKLPRCTTCDRSMSPSGVGSSSNIGERQNELRRFLTESEQQVRSSLAFRAARAVAKLGRRE